MAQQGPDLGVHMPVDRLEVVHFFRLEEENPSGAMRREVLLGEVVVITGGDDPVERQPPGVAMVGVEPVPLPRIVAQHDVRPGPADRLANQGPLGQPAAELAVGHAEEIDAGQAEDGGGGVLLAAAGLDQGPEVGVRVPGPFGAVGEHEQQEIARVVPNRGRRASFSRLCFRELPGVDDVALDGGPSLLGHDDGVRCQANRCGKRGIYEREFWADRSQVFGVRAHKSEPWPT